MADTPQTPVMDGLSANVSPFMPSTFVPAAPPSIAPRGFPTPTGSNPALMDGIARFLAGLHTQEQNQQLPTPQPATPATPNYMGLQFPGLFHGGALLRHLAEKAQAGQPMGQQGFDFFNKFLAGQGQAPLGIGMLRPSAAPMAPSPAPMGIAVGESMGGAQPMGLTPNFPTPQSFSAPIGMSAQPQNTFAQQAQQSQIGMGGSASRNQNIGSNNPLY